MHANWIVMHDISALIYYRMNKTHKDRRALYGVIVSWDNRIGNNQHKKCTFQHFLYFNTCNTKCNPPFCSYHNTSKKMPDNALLLPGRSHSRLNLEPEVLSLLGQLQPCTLLWMAAQTRKPSSLHMQISINAVIALICNKQNTRAYLFRVR
jgi:hypothetical protein